MAVLKSYNYGLIYRRVSSKYFNMHDYSLLEAMNLWHRRDYEYDKIADDLMNGDPERDIIFITDLNRRQLEFPNRKTLYVVEATGGLWTYQNKWVLLNPKPEDFRIITKKQIDNIVGKKFDDVEDNPKFESDIQFITELQRRNLVNPRSDALYIVAGEDGIVRAYIFVDGVWNQIENNEENIINITSMSNQTIDEILEGYSDLIK